MIASEKSQDLSEAILTLLAPCEGIVKFRHAILVFCKNMKIYIYCNEKKNSIIYLSLQFFFVLCNK